MTAAQAQPIPLIPADVHVAVAAKTVATCCARVPEEREEVNGSLFTKKNHFPFLVSSTE